MEYTVEVDKVEQPCPLTDTDDKDDKCLYEYAIFDENGNVIKVLCGFLDKESASDDAKLIIETELNI